MEDNRILDLVQAAHAGSREAFGELVREFQPSVYGVVVRRLRNSAEASEVTQDVFLRAYRSLDTVDPDRELWPWLSKVAERTAIAAPK